MDNKPIRILHYIKHLETGGGETLVYNIYNNIDRKKFQFDFAVNTEKEEYLTKKVRNLGAYVYSLVDKEPHFIVAKMILCSSGLKKLLNQCKYEIVHIHCSNAQGLLFAHIAKKAGIPHVIVHIHNSGVDGRFKSVKKIVHKYLKNKYINEPDEYMACSVMAARWLYNDNIINSKHFNILKNGINIDKYIYDEKKRNIIRAQFNINKNDVLLCNIGRMVPEKNQKFILKVIDKLNEEGGNYKLLLIGQGPLKKELCKYIKKKGLRESVIIIDKTSYVEKYLFASDIFLLPSVKEGLGIVAIEAETAGLRTIVSNGVPDDVIITPIIKKLNSYNDINEWVTTIKECIQNNDRMKNAELVRKNGFDIRIVSEWLQNYYSTIVEREKYE